MSSFQEQEHLQVHFKSNTQLLVDKHPLNIETMIYHAHLYLLLIYHGNLHFSHLRHTSCEREASRSGDPDKLSKRACAHAC